MVPCETNFRQQCQPDEEKNWERQFLALLTPALMGDPFSAFGYNAVGNVTSNGEEGGSSYIYNSNGLLAHAVKQMGTKIYAYDLCGNMVSRNGQSLTYDAENHLSSVTQNGATVATFGYDDSGERLWKQSANTLYVWNGNLFEARGTTNLYYIYAGPRRICVYSPAIKLPGFSGNSDYNYYHPDHLGSSSVMTDAAGVQVENYTYTAYGRERANGAATPDETHRYTGQVFDFDTGLYYYRARYYDPELARFAQPDTVIPSLWNPQSWNRYSYVFNNPLKYTDPTGHWGKEFADWWSGVVQTASETYSAEPQHSIWDRIVGTANSLVGGVADPLRLGSDAGRVSADGGTAGQILWTGVQEAGRAVAIVPVGAAIGKGVGSLANLARAGEREAVAELSGTLKPSGEPCFVAGTLIASNDGWKPIEGTRPLMIGVMCCTSILRSASA